MGGVVDLHRVKSCGAFGVVKESGGVKKGVEETLQQLYVRDAELENVR